MGFILLSVATVLSVARWMMQSSHQTAVALVKQRGMLPKVSTRNLGAASSTQPESAASTAIPVADLPLVGIYVGDDQQQKKELEIQLKEISSLVPGGGVKGVLSFRTLLAGMGMAVPDPMTETEAAAEFLRRTERFSALLAQWREAVGIGPWDFTSMETNDIYATKSKFLREMALPIQSLLGAMAEAHLRTGDPNRAWSDLKTMDSSIDRCGDMLPNFGFNLSSDLLRTAQSGMDLGAWTDTQLMGISTILGKDSALATNRRDMEMRKILKADYFAHFRENQIEVEKDFSFSKSPIDRAINRIGIATVTDQQLADNLTVIEYQMDQPFTRFDPDTGFYMGKSSEDSYGLPRSKPSDISFERFYYMYSELYGGGYDYLPNYIIREQFTIDRTRIASALEIQHRATGEYPATLDAVGGNPLPRDIATGQPYFYQRNADGGYTLWGTGIDGTSQNGDKKSDVSWTQMPRDSN